LVILLFGAIIIGIKFAKSHFFKKASKSGLINAGLARQLGISKRELEVLQLVAQGLSNKQIADKLFLAEITVKKHISSLFIKLNAKRRTEAVRYAKDISLLT
jgi:ATP/maltotriose-dependent transcriptional regulator MalT